MRLVIRDLEKNFDKKTVLDHAGYTFRQGKIYGILGAQGAGKTTFFQCLMGEQEYENGLIELTRNSVAAKLDNQDIGIVFDKPVLPDFMSGYEFVKYYMDLHMGESDLDLTPMDYLSKVGIDEEEAYHLIKDYAEDAKNRLQFLYIMIASPAVILLDEPFSGQGETAVEDLKKILSEIKDNHITLIATSSLESAKDFCDEFVLLDQGFFQGVSFYQLEEEGYGEKLTELLSLPQEDIHA